MIKLRNNQEGSYLPQGNEDKLPLVHQRMGNDEARMLHGERFALVKGKQNINIDEAVVINTILRLLGTAQIALNLMGSIEHGKGRKRSVDGTAGIQETVFRLESPWLGNMKSGEGRNGPYPLFHKLQGSTEVALLIA